jgi:GDP-mannose 6-dehydrogenase
MEMACADTKLNISKAYLRPGFAYGGSCLPKDLRAVVAEGRYGGQSLPTLESIARSNSEHIAHAGRIIRSLLPTNRGARVLVCGLTFKEHTDDLRESPVIELVERLLRSGSKVRVYDPLVTVERLIGTNLLYQRTHVPDLSELLAEDLGAEIAAADVVVYYHGGESVINALTSAKAMCPVVDLSNALRRRVPAPRYYSII